MLKKISLLMAVIFLGLASIAEPKDDVLAFFDKYVAAANTYSESIPDFYEPNAKIVRVVVKKDGTKESVTSDTAVYMKQLKMNAKIAKVRNYRNFYTDRVVTPVGNDFKLTCKRQPSTSDYKLPAYFIIGKNAQGQYKIKEESMHTYQTAILYGAKKEQQQ